MERQIMSSKVVEKKFNVNGTDPCNYINKCEILEYNFYEITNAITNIVSRSLAQVILRKRIVKFCIKKH